MALSPADLTVILPTLNEVKNIVVLIPRLRELYPGINIIVSDDQSTDGTQKAVDDLSQAKSEKGGGVFLLERDNADDHGITASVLDALSYVGTGCFAVMDADLQHPPEVLGQLLEELTEDIDFVLAARVPYRENQGLHRILATKVTTLMAHIFLRLRGLCIADPMSGFFLARTDMIMELVQAEGKRFERRGYKILFDILRIIDPAVRYRQVFYQFALREEGLSKLKPVHALYFLRSFFK